MQSGSPPPRRSSRQRKQNARPLDAIYLQQLYNKPKLPKNTLKNVKDARSTYKAMREKLNKEELPERLPSDSRNRREGFAQNKHWEDKKNTLNESYMKLHKNHVRNKKLLENSLKPMPEEKPSSKRVLINKRFKKFQTSKRALQEYIGEYGAMNYIESSRKGEVKELFGNNPMPKLPFEKGRGLDQIYEVGKGRYVIVEAKGGKAKLSMNQMSNPWVNEKIGELMNNKGKQSVTKNALGKILHDALAKGKVSGVTITTNITPGNKRLNSTMTDHGYYSLMSNVIKWYQ